MKTRTTRNSLLLVLTAFIWGISFVSQSTGGDAVGPFSFTCVRSIIGTIVLLPVIVFMDRKKISRKPETPQQKKILLTGGICCGLIMFVASNLQQLGITMGTPVGKAGFLTACYIVIVPIMGLFLKKKCSWTVWIGVVLTVIGLYLLCIEGSLSTFTFQLSDILLILCAVAFATHILTVDHFSPLVDGVRLSCIQFFVCGIITALPMIFTELVPAGSFTIWASAFATQGALVAILYAGICSCGIAFTLQIIGQQDVNPTVASLLMSLESVFSVLGGWMLLHEQLSRRELIGCAVIFVAVVLAQIPVKSLRSMRSRKQGACHD